MAVRHSYEVLVGGTSVYRSGYHETSVGKRQAVTTYNDYVKKSKEGIGWASGQGVELLQDDKPVRKFVGYFGNPKRKKKGNPSVEDIRNTLAGHGYRIRRLGSLGRGRLIAEKQNLRIEVDYKHGFDSYVAWRFFRDGQEIANNYTHGDSIPLG